MPRIVDHAARRQELATAALAIVREEGPQALSVRRLAGVTGWSSGALRHYVPDVDALAGLLLEQVSSRIQGSVAAILADACPGVAATDTVVACLAQVLPLDADREVEFAVWRHFWGQDRQGVEAEWVWTGQRMFHRQLVLLLAGAQVRELTALPGELPAALEAWAAHLHAVVDGLALRAGLAVPDPGAEQVLRDLRHAVDVVAAGVREAAS